MVQSLLAHCWYYYWGAHNLLGSLASTVCWPTPNICLSYKVGQKSLLRMTQKSSFSRLDLWSQNILCRLIGKMSRREKINSASGAFFLVFSGVSDEIKYPLLWRQKIYPHLWRKKIICLSGEKKSYSKKINSMPYTLLSGGFFFFVYVLVLRCFERLYWMMTDSVWGQVGHGGHVWGQVGHGGRFCPDSLGHWLLRISTR